MATFSAYQAGTTQKRLTIAKSGSAVFLESDSLGNLHRKQSLHEEDLISLGLIRRTNIPEDFQEMGFFDLDREVGF